MWTNCIVAALSHFAMGRISEAPPHARAGAPMSTAQEAIWQSVHDRVAAFMKDVRQADGGAKLASVAADIEELERMLETEIRLRDDYVGDSGRAVLGEDGAQVAPLVADDVALPSQGSFFDASAYLFGEV